MAGEYYMNWTDASIKQSFVLNLNTRDVSTTALTLFGKGTASYGEGLQENLLRLLENFCSATPPTIKTVGQLWFDYGTKTIKVWDGDKWSSTSTQVSDTTPTAPTNGMMWLNPADQNLNYWTGTSWKIVTPIASFNAHANDTSLHISAAQNTLLDGIIVDFSAINNLAGSTDNIQSQINAEIAARLSAEMVRDNNFSSHVSDNSKHLTAAQNTWIDGITATSTEINYLSGVTGSVQAHITDNDKHLTATQNAWIDGITVTSAQVNFLTGATSNIQTQINSLAGSSALANHASDQSLHLTASQNTWIDGVTAAAAEVNYLVGATSNIQTQMNAKPTINPATPKDGDIKIVGSVISIYASTAWRQIYPAVYS